jgi:hypothetical protein
MSVHLRPGESDLITGHCINKGVLVLLITRFLCLLFFWG